jgi:hypothetical protein
VPLHGPNESSVQSFHARMSLQDSGVSSFLLLFITLLGRILMSFLVHKQRLVGIARVLQFCRLSASRVRSTYTAL